jgi:hypothetical protein
MGARLRAQAAVASLRSLRTRHHVGAGVAAGERGDWQGKTAIRERALRRRQRVVQRLAGVDDILDRGQLVARGVGQRIEALGRGALAGGVGGGKAHLAPMVVEHAHHAIAVGVP